MIKKVEQILNKMRANPKGIKYSQLCIVCDCIFGESRQTGGSYRIYKTPWIGDPRINIQDHKGMAKPYPVRQVIKAIDLMEKSNNVEE